MEGRISFAGLLRTARERAGISQYRLGRLAGISKQSLSRLELGLSQPSWETVQRLVTALGTDYQSLADPHLKLPKVGPPAKQTRKVIPSAPVAELFPRESRQQPRKGK